MLLGSKPVEVKAKKQRQAEGGVGLWGISMKLQMTPWKTLNLGWPFKPVSSWGKKDRALYCYVIGGKLLQKDAIGWGDALQPRLFSKRTDNWVLYRQYFLVGPPSSWETKSLIPKRWSITVSTAGSFDWPSFSLHMAAAMLPDPTFCVVDLFFYHPLFSLSPRKLPKSQIQNIKLKVEISCYLLLYLRVSTLV